MADGVLPAQVVEAAQVMATQFEPEVYVPPLPGEEVRKATGDERDEALLFSDMPKRLPAGLSRDDQYQPASRISSTAPEAHVNISGISGVATKTSYATFLLYSLFHSGALGAESANTKALIFNVKGEDLLFLDHANVALGPDQPALRPPRPALGAVRLGRLLRPAGAGRPQRQPRRRRPPAGRHLVLLDPGPVLRRRGAPVPVRRLRGRPPAVHRWSSTT